MEGNVVGVDTADDVIGSDDIDIREETPRTPLVWPPLPPGYTKPPAWMEFVRTAPQESCIFKTVLSGTMGYGLGLFCGLLFGGYSQAVDKAVEMDAPSRVKLRIGFREAGKAMNQSGRHFAYFGAIYAGSECVIEKIRARNDLYNATMAGCVTGAILASSPRTPIPPKARTIQMASGCGAIAAFSTAIDYYMKYWE